MTTFGYHTGSIVPLQAWSYEQSESEADPDRNESQSNAPVIPAVVAAEHNRVAKKECILQYRFVNAPIRILESPYQKTVNERNVKR